ncbi:MAG: metal-dependent transcriptional regulator [Phycisphaerales bacterium]|nr:metal-dependent transcriptional regulator [Phycisphaerales bacterium]
MPSSTVENYLKRIYLEEQADPGAAVVSMKNLAGAMGVTPGTATSMAKSLADSRFVAYEPYGGVKLTARGRTLALRILRRHRLIECFLVEALGLDWSEVHDEAESLEHAISDKLLDRIDEFLGFPSVDPHGDPIPTAAGEVRQTLLTALTDVEEGADVRIARILDQDEKFLRFVDRHRLRPGTRGRVLAHDHAAEAVTIQSGKLPAVTMGRTAAAKIMVEIVKG